MNHARWPVCALPMRGTWIEGGIGTAAAAALGHALLEDAVAMIRTRSWARVVRAFDDDVGWVMPQALCEQEDGAAIAIGAASPGLPAMRLEDARAALVLGHAEAVLGPSSDGGLYLIAVRRCSRGLLAGLPWGTRDAFATAQQRLRSRGLAPLVLDRWFAIDGPDGIARARGLIRAGVIDAPQTRRLLAPRIVAVVPSGGAEAEALAATLASLDRVAALEDVVIADPTTPTARPTAGRADVIWFVQPGTLVPPDADRYIVDALLDPEVVAGAFSTQRSGADDTGWRSRLQPAGRIADLRAMLTGLSHAGQALFVRASALERAAGETAFLGDGEPARWLRSLGRVVRVPARVVLSAPPSSDDAGSGTIAQITLASLIG